MNNEERKKNNLAVMVLGLAIVFVWKTIKSCV